MRGRGQTQYDYVVGITLMLLTISSVFLLIPDIFAPAQDPVAPEERSAADRLANYLVSNSSVQGTTNTLNYSRLDETLGPQWAETKQWANRSFGREISVNVRNRTSDGTVLIANETAEWTDSSPAAVTTRIVRFENNSVCDSACRLTVRVWFDG